MQVCVHEECRHKGYGGKFVALLIEKEKKFTIFYATLLFSNIPSQKMLLKYGFQSVSEEENQQLRNAQRLQASQQRFVYERK